MTPTSSVSDTPHSLHKDALNALTRGTLDELTRACDALPEQPVVHTVRAPDIGLVMVQGRTSGTGSPFNLGEVSVTRATVRLDSGTLGFGYVMGRNRQQARLCAVFDALWQNEDTDEEPAHCLIAQIRSRLERQDTKLASETAATKVDFFTLVRGEDK